MIKKLIPYCFILFFIAGAIGIIGIAGCKDNPVETAQSYGLKYERDGLLDSITGDCSTILTRVIYLDSIDFRGASKVKLEYNAHTDADISFLRFFYLQADTAVNIISLDGASEISNMHSIEVDAPQTKQYFYVRMALRSSVCTGDIFHIKLRDLKVYTK